MTFALSDAAQPLGRPRQGTDESGTDVGEGRRARHATGRPPAPLRRPLGTSTVREARGLDRARGRGLDSARGPRPRRPSPANVRSDAKWPTPPRTRPSTARPLPPAAAPPSTRRLQASSSGSRSAAAGTTPTSSSSTARPAASCFDEGILKSASRGVSMGLGRPRPEGRRDGLRLRRAARLGRDEARRRDGRPDRDAAAGDRRRSLAARDRAPEPLRARAR